MIDQAHLHPMYGAAPPTLEERIWDSDVIVRALLISDDSALTAELNFSAELRFRVIEYLKGEGPSEITVRADKVHTVGRNTFWDSAEAVLFLSRAQGQGPEASGASTGDFSFTNARGDKHPGFALGTKNAVWLPTTQSAKDASGASDAANNPDVIVDAESLAGEPHPTVSLSELRTMIAWVEGDGTAEYDHCIGLFLNGQNDRRDWEAYYGSPRPHAQTEWQLASGLGEGTVIWPFQTEPSPFYDKFWLIGPDKDRFQAVIVDDDTDPSNGYTATFMTARPLPEGEYRVFTQFQPYELFACNLASPDDPATEPQLEWIITVEAPPDAVHETLFDPVAIGGAVGVDFPQGILEPSPSLTDGGFSIAFGRVVWESGLLTMELGSSGTLAGHHADFIGLDGAVALRLDFEDAIATVGGSSTAVTWNVCEQPWNPGDLLMLRISRSGNGLTGATNDELCGGAPF